MSIWVRASSPVACQEGTVSHLADWYSRAQAMEDGKENLDDDGQPRGTLPPSEPAVSPEAASNEPGAAGSVDAAVSRLVDLLYFSQV